MNDDLVYVWRKGQKKQDRCATRTRHASMVCVAESMSWDITTKEKTLFEIALDGENLSWEEPMLDESGAFLDAEMPDTVSETADSRRRAHFPRE